MAEIEYPDLGNALVRQKDKILGLCNADKLSEAYAHLTFVRDLWESTSYGYKIWEVLERIKRNILQMRNRKRFNDLLSQIDADLCDWKNSPLPTPPLNADLAWLASRLGVSSDNHEDDASLAGAIYLAVLVNKEDAHAPVSC